MARLCVESRDAFAFAACCSYLDLLSPGDAAVTVMRPRDPDFVLFTMCRGRGAVTHNDSVIRYEVQDSPDPMPTESRPEKYRELWLDADRRESILTFVSEALRRHRERVTEPRGLRGFGRVRFSWDDSTQTWDAGKLVPLRPMSSLYLPDKVADDILVDLKSYLQTDTMDTYQTLHVTPVRVYMLHGLHGAGKTSLIHCLASETARNLAMLSFEPHTTDDDLRTALRDLPDACFLCLEDVDCLFDERRTKGHGVNFASFLAVLDGAYSKGALTVFMTTNCMANLDPAVRRRVDYLVEFAAATKDQCWRMFRGFYPNKPSDTFRDVWRHVEQYTFSTSVFQKFLMRSLPHQDPLRCIDVFKDLVEAHGSRQVHQYYT